MVAPHITTRRGPAHPEEPAGLQHLLDALVLHAEDLHATVDLEGRFTFVNDAAQRVLGHPARDCLGRSAFDFVHADDRERTRRAFDGWVADAPAEPLHLDNRQVSRTGEESEVAWTIYPQRDGEGQLTGFATTGRDVTARRLGERRVLRLSRITRALLDGMLDPVIVIDDHGTIQLASRSVQAVFGWDPDELKGQNVTLLMPEPTRSLHDEHLARYRRTRRSQVVGRTLELAVLHRCGQLLDVELSVAEVDTPDEGTLFIGSFRDVTARRRAERAERSMLKALASLGESAAILAHEIKNPITAVNLALRSVGKSLGEDEQEVVTDLAARMRHLEQQLRQTLSFARPLDLSLKTCDAEQLLERVARSLAPVLDAADVSLERCVAPGSPTFEADALRLQEVLTNLVMNAVEMLPPGGRVRVAVEAGESCCVRIEVQDDGPGVPTRLRETLFQPFVTSKDQGTGLGLPISRRIIEEHGGTLGLVDETPTGDTLPGARFRICLPIDSPCEGPAP